jgi:hypothetical protein
MLCVFVRYLHRHLLPWRDFVSPCDPALRRRRQHDLMAFSRELHGYARPNSRKAGRCSSVGTLIALRNKALRFPTTPYALNLLRSPGCGLFGKNRDDVRAKDSVALVEIITAANAD